MGKNMGKCSNEEIRSPCLVLDIINMETRTDANEKNAENTLFTSFFVQLCGESLCGSRFVATWFIALCSRY